MPAAAAGAAAPLAPASCPLAALDDSTKLADSANEARDAVEAEGRMAAGVGTLSLSLPERPRVRVRIRVRVRVRGRVRVRVSGRVTVRVRIRV